MLVIILVIPVSISNDIFGQSRTEGYYKDLFMDGGVNLTSRKTLPAAEYLNLSMEYIATGNENIQSYVMIFNSHDHNGVLLYPDGEPRFRLIYTNGGTAANHGESLGESGRQIIRTYSKNGGSFTGSCAGAFISSLGTDPAGSNKVQYYHIWPGYACLTGQKDIRTGHFIGQDSPLLQYYDFGGDNYVSNVYHNGGGYAYEPNMPSGTEILARYDYPTSAQMHNKASVWAYSDADNPEAGRVVVIGSHPEGVTSGERLDLMAAVLRYASDGVGEHHVKSELSNGEIRIMDKSTGDKDPDYTKIGDKQYHHFTIDLPEGASTLTLNITGDDKFDLSLYVNRDDFAFNSTAVYKDRAEGSNKILTISDLSSGKYYISVECETTVSSRLEQNEQDEFYGYIDNLDVLNGVAYTIQADWSTSTDIKTMNAEDLNIYPNPFSTGITLQWEQNVHIEEIDIFDLQGNTVYKQKIKGPSFRLSIEPGNHLEPGTYYLRIRSGDKVYVRKIIKVAH